MHRLVDAGTLANVASVIGAFGAAMLFRDRHARRQLRITSIARLSPPPLHQT
jgi:hypothetical protein